MKTRISGGRVLDPANGIDEQLDVFIADGKILAVASELDDFTADQKIEARDKWIIPGLVDLSARLREPGQEHKATIQSETRAAAAAGITTLDADDPLWTSFSATARYGIVYDDTPTTPVIDPLIVLLDLLANKTGLGGNFYLTLHANGIMRAVL